MTVSIIELSIVALLLALLLVVPVVVAGALRKRALGRRGEALDPAAWCARYYGDSAISRHVVLAVLDAFGTMIKDPCKLRPGDRFDTELALKIGRVRVSDIEEDLLHDIGEELEKSLGIAHPEALYECATVGEVIVLSARLAATADPAQGRK